MKRPKYHFLKLETTSTGSSFFALPGQSFGRNAVPIRALVKDRKSPGPLAKLKRNAKPGDLFFSTTLTMAEHHLVVSDAYPLNENIPVFFADVQDEYRKYLLNNAT